MSTSRKTRARNMLRQNVRASLYGVLAATALFILPNTLSLIEVLLGDCNSKISLPLSLTASALYLAAYLILPVCFPYYLRISRGVALGFGDYLSELSGFLGRSVLLSLACILKIALATALPFLGYILTAALSRLESVTAALGYFIFIPELVSLALWCVCVIVAIKTALGYALVYLIGSENRSTPIFAVLRLSETLMDGSKAQLALLLLSFIGWGLFSALTLGVGNLFKIPYLYCSLAFFYRDLIGDTVNE